MQPKNYEASIGLGVALRGNKKIDDAENQYKAAQKLDSSNPSSYFNLGLLYQDYKDGQKPALHQAQDYYRQFLSHDDRDARPLKREAEKRIKDIDEIYVALDEAAKMQAEAEEMQRKAEEQQKQMEEADEEAGGEGEGRRPPRPAATSLPRRAHGAPGTTLRPPQRSGRAGHRRAGRSRARPGRRRRQEEEEGRSKPSLPTPVQFPSAGPARFSIGVKFLEPGELWVV
jgi:tetratricopeptide (TPR) repeat protein